MFSRTKLPLDDQVFHSIFNSSDFSDSLIFRELHASSEITLIDRLDDQVGELIKADNPSKSFTQEELTALVIEFFNDHDRESFGNWVYYPWRKTLVRILPEEEFIKVRTQRNNYKITPQEQQELRKKKIGLVGLSVGRSIAVALALERGCGELRLADFDTLELSNLNRIKSGIMDLGTEKVILAAREIVEIDPYLKITLFRQGISEDNIDSFLSNGGDLDLLIDECDSLDIKVLLREKARARKIPVLMETSDRGMLDIERFDREPSREIFHGFLGDFNFSDLKNLTNQQKLPIGLKIIGLNTISTRMKVSLLEVSQSISSWPQLASAVYLGGATVANASRKLLLGENVSSGRYYVDLDELVSSKGEKSVSAEATVPMTENDFIGLLPKNEYTSAYKVSNSELIHLVEKANTAPSGGNSQPWKWIFDKRGVLHLLHDKSKSESLLDYLGTGSLLAFGAALQNLKFVAASMGIELTIHQHIQHFEEELIASIVFNSKADKPIPIPNLDLLAGVDLRCTNRKNAPRVMMGKGELAEFQRIASEDGVGLEFIDDLGDLKDLTPIVGGMDRLRLLHDQGYRDFISEIRWSEQEAVDTKDGIDIATLEMGKPERAAIGLVRDPGTIEFFRKNDLGYGLTKISDQTILSASAVLMFTADEYTADYFLKTGAAIQRVWIKANLSGYSLQPISASLFVFHRVLREAITGFSDGEKRMILQFKHDLNQIFNKDLSKQEVFMVRINKASEPSMRAFRRDVSASLILL